MSKDLPQDEILARYLNREITENQLLQESEGLDELMQLAQLTEKLEVPSTKTSAQAWADLSEKISAERIHAAEASSATVKPMKLSSPAFLMRIAAVGLVLLATYVFWPKSTNVQTSFAQTEMVSLPDGSEVQLFSSSEISFKKGKWDKARELRLEGEAYFDVEKGSTFTVMTSAGSVKVLGTTFNVYQRDNEFEVVCYSGKVEVRSENGTALLMPGESAQLSNNQLLKNELPEDVTKPYWMGGEISLEKASWDELSELIERYYGYTVVLDQEVDDKFTGTFYTQNVENALKVICKPIELNYIFEDNRIIRIKK